MSSNNVLSVNNVVYATQWRNGRETYEPENQ